MEQTEAMSRGIYIMANDSVIENAIALLNSIRLYDADVPVIMIPYDEQHLEIARTLKKHYGVEIYEDPQLLKKLPERVNKIFGKKFFTRVNQFRKQACWFGPFDEFLYLDTDIVVFEKIIDSLDYLSQSDFICCDYQYLNGVKFLFTQKLLEVRIFSDEELRGVFNAGFWGSKRGLISENDLYQTLEECAQHLDYFDFSKKVSDMPIFNYLVLKLAKRCFNIVKDTGKKGAGSWAGMPHFVHHGNQLIDPNVNQPLKYLHWAGIKIEPGCPYYDIWNYYRQKGIGQNVKRQPAA